MKNGSSALITFADFHRHFKYSKEHWNEEEKWMKDKPFQDKHREECWNTGWFWNDYETIKKIINKSPFKSYKDVTPLNFRDRVILLTK